MAYIHYNENPCNKNTIDCTVRGLSIILGEDWDSVYTQLCCVGFDMCDMPSSKAVVNQFLRFRGFTRHVCPDKCPDCYTVEEFANEHPVGVYLLCTDSHVIPVINGNYIDTWDSGNEVPMYFWKGE